MDQFGHRLKLGWILEDKLGNTPYGSGCPFPTFARRKLNNRLDAPYHWIQTFVTDDKLYCIHIAPDKETVIEHARIGGFLTNNIVEVRTIMDPSSRL
jgi:hypothetical protein